MKLKKFQLLALATLLALLTLPASASALNFVQPAGSPYPTGKLTANSVLTGDLNGDGRDDLVTANGDYSFSSFIAGPSGALTQAAGSPYPTGAGNYALAGTLGDFTSDDNLDVAIAHNNKVVIYPGTGTGTFGAALPEITTTVNGEDITTGRFNNDSIPDLAVAGWSTNNVQIFYGNGSGGTSGSDTVPVGPGPVSIVAADFNQDGLSDFATANLEVTFGLPLSAGAVSVVLNDDGSFSQAPGSPLGGYYQPHGITVGDFNDDGNQDITVVSRTARSLLVRLGNGDGTFADAPSDPDIWSQWGNSVASADFDGDGFGDILVGMATNLVTPGTDSAPIFLGSASGTMTASPDGPWFTTSPSYPWEVATGDFNADGHPDWVSGDQGGRMSVFMNEIPGLSASPSSLPFGSLAVGTGPTAPQSSTITSSGIGTVTVPAGAVTIAGTHPDQFDIDSEDCDDTVLNQGDSCEVSVTFSPTSTGAKSAVLQVFSDADGSPTNIALSGTGLANPDISIDPASHDFGNVPVGSAGTAVTFTVESAGTTNLNVTDVQLTGAEAGQFDIVSEDCDGASLTPGSTCEIEVDFLPTSIGTKSAELAISSNAPGDPHSVALAGEGAANTNYTLSPLTQDFGTRITGDGPGPSSTFTVTSTGTTDLETGQVSLSGGDSDQFQVTSDGCSNQTLAPNATCEIGVAFAPTSAGEKSAELWVDIQNWTGPPILLPPAQLTGSGQDPLPPPTPCEPVAVQKIAYFTPKVKRRSLSPGVRARITTAGPSVVRVSSKLIYHLNGRQGQVNYKQRQFRITGDSVNYKVAIPRKLRKKLKPGKQVRLVITYASKAPNPECTRFGEKKTRNLTTRIVRIIPNT